MKFQPHPQTKSISDKIAAASGHPSKPVPATTGAGADSTTSSTASTSSMDDGDDDDNY